MTIGKQYSERLLKLRKAFSTGGIDAVLISHPRHIFYFTGRMPGQSPVFLLVSDDRELMISPVNYEEIDSIQYVDYDIWNGWDLQQNIINALNAAFHQRNLQSCILGYEENHLQGYVLRELLKKENQLVGIDNLLWNLRKIKDVTEIARIEANVKVNDDAFMMIQEILQPGISELALWSKIHETMREKSGVWFQLEGDLGCGVRGEDLGAQPGNDALKTGECVFIDIYSAMHGYYADTTRVFSIGKPSKKQLDIHKVLEDALFTGENELRPGVAANQIDDVVRKVINRAGYGDYFTHHTGHAYGLFQQEKPFIIPADSTPIESGMILTIEPGIYIPGWGGMRIEGNYVIENGSARRLDHYPSSLTICMG
jgi:Xaa-Pro aminopeptidase